MYKDKIIKTSKASLRERERERERVKLRNLSHYFRDDFYLKFYNQNNLYKTINFSVKILRKE